MGIIINNKINSRIYVMFVISIVFLMILAVTVEAGRRGRGGGDRGAPCAWVDMLWVS